MKRNTERNFGVTPRPRIPVNNATQNYKNKNKTASFSIPEIDPNRKFMKNGAGLTTGQTVIDESQLQNIYTNNGTSLNKTKLTTLT